MSVTMYRLTVPVLIRGFSVLTTYLDKAEAFAIEKNIAPATLIGARLAPDMLPLAGQIQRASDNAKGALGRLTGVEVPGFADTESTFDELRERIAKTVVLLETFTPAQFEGSEERSVKLTFRSVTGTLRGKDYVTTVLLPNFFFHIATAHDILRHNGLAIGKKDYFGTFGPDLLID